MRLIRIEHDGVESYASWEPGDVARLWSGAPWHGGSPTNKHIALEPSMLRAPVEPSKVLCVGRNYAAHARELGNEVPKEPLLFLKAPTSVVGPHADVTLPAHSERVEFEGEIGVVIGQVAKDVSVARAREVIFGVTALDDITARDLQRKDVQFTRAKSFDGFCPVGPCIDTELDPSDLELCTRVNGILRQRAHTRAMSFPILELIAYMSQQMTLLPGDLVATGTPEGVGPLQAGDEVEVEVGGLPVLRHGVVAPG